MASAPGPNTAAISNFLGEVSLFQFVGPEHRQKIASRLELCSFQRDHVVYEAGAHADALYIIQNGSVGLFRVEPLSGIPFELERLRHSQVFGAMELMTEEPRSATVRTLEPTLCFKLAQSTFARVLEKIPAISISISQILAQRVREYNQARAIEMRDLTQVQFDPEIFKLVPPNVLEHHKMIPLNTTDGILTVACVDPFDVTGLDEVRRAVRCIAIKPVAVRDADYQQFVDRHIKPIIKSQQKAGPKQQAIRVQSVQFVSGDEQEQKGADVGRGEEVKNYVERIVAEAIEREASDIHIEPEREGVTVRYRVSGRLQKGSMSPIPRALHRAIASRFKILAELDISERRLPQDGRISCEAIGRAFDMRINSLPSQDGEKLVLRMLDSAKAMQPLEKLITADDVQRAVHQMVGRPYGVVYVCGPTGSGKTTTLYSCLGVRKREDTNITTVEDPVEYSITGITQVGVKPDVGLNFHAVLRAILRQDPNVILVGETRDLETGKLVLEAGLTGHLVLTSLHTNDALGTVQRMREMGLDNFAIASSLVGVLAQRLVRAVCPLCALDAPISQTLLDQLVMADVMTADFRGNLKRSRGCASCGASGYRGRCGVYELLVADDLLRQKIAANADMYELRAQALQGLFVPMTRYTNYLLMSGATTPEEGLSIHSGRQD